MKRRLCMGMLCLLCLMVVIMAFPVSAARVSGTCGENITWVLENGVLTISGSGKMSELVEDASWKDHSDEITKVVIEEGVTSICRYAFYQCEALESVVISGSVTEIGERAFFGCNALKTVEFRQGLQTIGEAAFNSCSSLTTVTFPESLTALGDYAFAYCTSLKKIYFLGDVPTVKNFTFEEVSASAYYLPENESWLNGRLGYHGGSLFVQPYYEEPKCGDNLLWHYADGVLTISGTGDMYTPADLDMWAEHRLNIKKVVIESGVTSISRQAFSFHTALEEVIIPETVTEIGGTAFTMCSSLKKVTIPNSVKTIGAACFDHCAELEEVHIGTGVTRIEGSIFSESPNLKIYFYGNAPEVGFPYLTNMTVTAYYPAGNSSWTADVRARYGENITWVSYGSDTQPEPTTQPTEPVVQPTTPVSTQPKPTDPPATTQPAETTQPTVAPTDPTEENTSAPSTAPSTQAPTEPSATQTPPTEPAEPKPTEDGNGLVILWISLGVVAIGGGVAAFLIIKRKK